MDRESTGSLLRTWLREEALSNRPDVDLTGSTELLRSGYLDSLLLIRLVTFIEAEFKVAVPDEQVVPANFRNVDSMTAFLERLQQQRTMDA